MSEEQMPNDGPPEEFGAAEERVGCGGPPAQHQFKPGQSGTPRGRQKSAKGLKSELLGHQRAGDDHRRRSGASAPVVKVVLLSTPLLSSGSSGRVTSDPWAGVVAVPVATAVGRGSLPKSQILVRTRR